MIAGLREYEAAAPATAFTAQIDLWEIVSHATRVTWICGIEIGQTTELGDAQEEQLLIEWIQAHTSSGGGTSTTPSGNGADAAYGGTVERFATSLATGGSPVVRRNNTFNVRVGYTMIWDPGRWLLLPANTRMVCRITGSGGAGPADSVTGASTLYLAEAG
jgi:hypothetical protein